VIVPVVDETVNSRLTARAGVILMKRRERGTKTPGATVRYDSKTERVVVSCPNRAEFRLPIEAFGTVARGTLEERASVTLSRDGDGLRWDVFDADYYWPFLMAVMLGPATWRRTSAKTLASMTSPAKARGSHANDAKGGRPRRRRVAT
jgi:uncharacterized protein DUF2442